MLSWTPFTKVNTMWLNYIWCYICKLLDLGCFVFDNHDFMSCDIIWFFKCNVFRNCWTLYYKHFIIIVLNFRLLVIASWGLIVDILMQQSKSIIAKEGEKYGLIDAIVSPEDLLKISRCWALDIAERRKPWISSLRRTDRLGSLSEAHEILKAARQQVNRTAPNMPQHKECLDSVEEGVNFGGYAGVLKVCMWYFLDNHYTICGY